MTDQEVSHLIEEFHVPLHVRRHCATVANFALELGTRLQAAGEPINSTLLRHGALLHDFMRVVDFRYFAPEKFPDPASKEDIEFWKKLRREYKGIGHEEAGARVLEERGFPDVATLVKKHRYLQINEGFNCWEEKLLYYADKRTKHDKIVSLKERLADGRERNFPGTEHTEESRKTEEKVFALEKEILTRIERKL